MRSFFLLTNLIFLFIGCSKVYKEQVIVPKVNKAKKIKKINKYEINDVKEVLNIKIIPLRNTRFAKTQYKKEELLDIPYVFEDIQETVFKE